MLQSDRYDAFSSKKKHQRVNTGKVYILSGQVSEDRVDRLSPLEDDSTYATQWRTLLSMWFSHWVQAMIWRYWWSTSESGNASSNKWIRSCSRKEQNELRHCTAISSGKTGCHGDAQVSKTHEGSSDSSHTLYGYTFSMKTFKDCLEFANLRHLWRRCDTRLPSKGRVYNTAVRSVLLYRWKTLPVRDLHRLTVFDQRSLGSRTRV